MERSMYVKPTSRWCDILYTASPIARRRAPRSYGQATVEAVRRRVVKCRYGEPRGTCIQLASPSNSSPTWTEPSPPGSFILINLLLTSMFSASSIP